MKFIGSLLVSALAVMAAPSSSGPKTQRTAISAPAGLNATLDKRTTYTGEGTIYTQDGVAGSCGVYNSDSALICALGVSWMQDEYKAPYCGDSIHVLNVGSNDGVGGAGNSITVTVQDTCQACDQDHIDFSVGAWNALTNNAPYGTIEIEWYFE